MARRAGDGHHAGEQGGRNHDGQAMGAKGRATQRRLIEATAALMEAHPIHDITVAGIAKRAGISTATFYLYFTDAPHAALAVVGEHPQSTPDLLEMIGAAAPAVEAFACARRFVARYAEVWQRHGPIFRARNLAAEAGDARFYRAREAAVWPLLTAMTRRIEASQAAGRLPAALAPAAGAAVLIALLERLSAILGAQPEAGEITREGLIDAAGFVAASMLWGNG